MKLKTFLTAAILVLTFSARAQSGAGLPECNVSDVCTPSGEGIFTFEGAPGHLEGTSGELYLNGKVVSVAFVSEKILRRPHPKFVIEGHVVERHWKGTGLEVTETSRVTEQTCYFINPKSKVYEETQTGCGRTEEVTLIITVKDKASTIHGSRYEGA